MAIELSPITEPAPATTPVEAEATNPKRGRGRPAGSPNKPKVQGEAPPEPPKKKRVANRPAEEPAPAEEPVPVETPALVEAPAEPTQSPRKKRTARVQPPVPIPVVPERPRPEDMLRQMHLDARQRIGDSFTARRDAWSNQLNAKYT